MTTPSSRYYSERTFSSWRDLKAGVAQLPSNWAFRGQADATWNLQTSLERVWNEADRDVAENTAITVYQRKAAGLREMRYRPANLLSLLAEMQHYGAPTRLQDWTKSFYVASFFAFEAERMKGDAAIWAIDLAWLKGEALGEIKRLDPALRKLTIRDDLSCPKIFDEIFIKNRTQLVLPVTAFEMNERLGIQQGLFLCPCDVRKTFSENLRIGDTKKLTQKCLKFNLSTKFRAEVLADLHRMNISAATLYPGLDGFAKSLNTELSILKNDPETFKKVKGGVEGAVLYL